jgi:hypothetical protein
MVATASAFAKKWFNSGSAVVQYRTMMNNFEREAMNNIEQG